MNKFMSRSFCLCILFVAGVVGEIIQRPLNAAMSVGNETVINCSSNIGVITWIYTTDCNSVFGMTLTDSNCDITSNHTSHYRTEKPGGFVCNLVVFDALLSHGGCYICADGIGVGRQLSAFVIVVDSNANVATNTTDLISEEYLMISNSISYGGPLLEPPRLPPSFYWTLQSDPNYNITSYTGTTTTNRASSYIVVKAQKPDVPPFVCNLFFSAPINASQVGADNNPPTYRTSWDTPTYKVSYPPENTSISETTMLCPYDKAVVLTCNASGYPLPTFRWFDLTKGELLFHEGPTAEINDGGIYKCVASNTIRDVAYSNESMPVNVSDCFTYEINPNPPSTCDMLCIVILVIAIYFGLNLLFFIVFIICYGCYENGQEMLNDRFPWLIKMLPCLNDEGCKCSVWIVYFVLLSIFAAFIFFPVILIMASCCPKKKKTSQANPTQSERNGRGAGSTQLNTLGATPTYQHQARMNVIPNPPDSLNSSGHFQQDPTNRPYPHSSNQQHQPEYWGNSGPYPQNPRNPRPPPRPSPSPLSTGGIVYAELGVDNQPMSRRPIQPIQDGSNTYADIALA